jgi:hypothetical protein
MRDDRMCPCDLLLVCLKFLLPTQYLPPIAIVLY